MSKKQRTPGPRPIRVSEHFGLGRDQAALDFVDVPVNTDVALFVDPFPFLIYKTEWYEACNRLVRSYFDELIKRIAARDRSGALKLLEHIGEANEARLGFSSAGSRGSGIGPEKARALFHSLEQSKAVRTGDLRDLADCDLFVNGISSDNISDMAIRLIKPQLVEYTTRQSKLYGLPTQNMPIGMLWNPESLWWEGHYAEVPMVNGEALLLVPKACVRRRVALDPKKFAQHYMKNFLQAEHIAAGDSLVKLLKNGEPRVTKKSLEERYSFTKDDIAEFSEKHPEILEKFKEDQSTSDESLTNERLEALRPDERQLYIPANCDELDSIPTGRDHATTYHRLVYGYLQTVFYPWLTLFDVEEKVDAGRKRIDIVANNTERPGFFHELSSLHGIRCPYVFFECKNYAEDLKNPEFDQLGGRSHRRRGEFGFIVCRSISDKALMLSRCRDVMNAGDGMILVLTDEDICCLLSLKSKGQDSAITDFLRRKLRDVQMS